MTLRQTKFFRFGLALAFAANLVHWRAFDVVMVALALSLLALRPLSRHELKQIILDAKSILIPLVALLIVIFIGYRNAQTPDEILNFRWISGFFIIFFSANLAKIDKNFSLKYFALLVICLIGAACFYNFKQTAYLPSYDNRFQGFYVNPNVYGLAFTLSFAFASGWLASLLHTKRYISTLEILALSLMSATIYLTYSRSSWMGCAAAIVVITLVYTKDRKILWPSLGISTSIVVMFLFNVFKFKERLLSTADLSASTSGAIRLQIWKANLKMFFENPWFGVGYWHNARDLRIYAEGIPESELHAHAHNQYLQFLSGTGLIGALLFLFLLISGFKYFIKTFRHSKDIVTKQMSLCGLLVLVALSFASLTDAPLDTREGRNVFMITIATCLGVIYSRKKSAPL